MGEQHPAGKKNLLGLPTLVGLVIANMIGAGVFTTSGFALGDLGSPVYVMAAWLAGGVIALCGAISYGMLATLMPASGGEYLFLSRAVHPLAGFVAGWISLLAGFTGAIAFAALALETYLAAVPALDAIPKNIIATLAILFAALIHGFQVKHGALVQNISVVLKLTLILCFLLFAATRVPGAEWAGVQTMQQETIFSIGAFATTLMWISLSYSGFNAAVYVAGEAEEARSRVPRAMVIATLLTTVIYVLLNSVFVLAPAYDDVASREAVAAIAAQALGGNNTTTLIRVTIVLALFTSVSSMVMVGPRVYAQMADDGVFPRILRYTRKTPDAAITLQALLAILVVWLSGLRELLSYLGFTLGLCAAATVASLFILAKKDGTAVTRLRGYPWIPLVFVGITLLFAGIAATRNPMEMLATVLTIITGVIMYYLFARGEHTHR